MHMHAVTQRLTGALCAGAYLVSSAAAAEPKCNDLKPDGSKPVAADGVSFKVLANKFKEPRGMVQDSEGNLLLVESSSGIRRLELDDGDGLDVCVKSNSQIIDDDTLNHGIALSGDGKTLFVSSITDAYAYNYDASKGTVSGDPKHIIKGMNQTGHQSRTLHVPRQNSGMLLISRGSDGNIDEGTVALDSARSQIRTFDIKDLLDGDDAVEYSSGKVLGWGLRNSVGVGDDPATGNIWSVENSIDEMKRDKTDVHINNPGEEMNFHGRPNETDSDMYGKNYGYPACVSIWDTASVKGYPVEPIVGQPMRGDQMPDNYTDSYCRDKTQPARLTFGAHLAPLDVKFREDGSAAYIAFHGSWNREPPNGYRLSCIGFKDGSPIAENNSTNAEARLLWNDDNSKCPNGECFRPVAMAVDDAKRRVFFTSDATNEVFVVTGVHENDQCNPTKNDQGDHSDDSSSDGDSESSASGPLMARQAWMGTYIAAAWSWIWM